MNIGNQFKDRIAAVLLGIVVVLQAFSNINLTHNVDTQGAAQKLSKSIRKDVAKLESYMLESLDFSCDDWLNLKGVPDYMVIYKYCQDTLQSWVGAFPVMNEDLKSRSLFPALTSARGSALSPLTQVSEELSYVNFGEKWYLAKMMYAGDNCIIGGIEINDESTSRIRNGIHRRFHIKELFAIHPLSYDCGSVVCIDEDKPLFIVCCENLVKASPLNATSLWLSLSLLIFAALIFLSAKRTIQRFIITSSSLSIVMLTFYIAGRSIRDRFTMFSPILYAGSDVLYSLGAIVIINLAILVLSQSIYLARAELCKLIKKRSTVIATIVIDILLVIGIIIFAYTTLRSIILNGSISLELYKISELSLFCVVVYVSFISTLTSLPLLIQSIEPLIKRSIGRSFNLFSRLGRIIWACVISLSLITCVSLLSFNKEQDRMQLISGRIAFDRDISLELYLKTVEDQIGDDAIVSALSVFNNTASIIKAHLSDYFFAKRERNYDFSVFVFNRYNNTLASARQFRQLSNGGVPISDNSRFLFVKRDNGQSYYLGSFHYLIEGSGLSRVLVRIDNKDTRDDKGYASIFGYSSAGGVTIPPGYSYARYSGINLVGSRGSYPYPHQVIKDIAEDIYQNGLRLVVQGSHRHFCNTIGENELIVLSRPKNATINYIVAFIIVAFVSFGFLSIVLIGRKRKRELSHSYFLSRIRVVLLISLMLTLIIVAGVSVIFVYSRNYQNNQSVMIDRINSLSSIIESNRATYTTERGDIDWRLFRQFIEKLGTDTQYDVTLYSTSGKMIMTTAPIVFEHHLLEDRISSEAYNQIMYEHRRVYVQRNSTSTAKYFSMYASVRESNGKVLAIICSPYNAKDFDFEEDAITHAATIITIFAVFALLALFFVSRIVDKMLRPLTAMSQKMSNIDLHSPEYIDYQQNDEIYSIVQAYNRMVEELMESSRKLAQTERNKAWSEMARQVAHEIKNPLTPMKLQIQRVVRLKANGNPAWLERFDQVSRLLLDHIDILTETANEFSSFAKLYTEEPTAIDLAKTIQSEISMFDNHSNIGFEYIGLEGVTVMGPKPQLTRVFVNLINNSVQAIGEAEGGLIRVSLRKSAKSGYYDIVFEDNGPGVDEKNVERLFTPNFTTKNGGSGLGLAISRSVLETCGATIQYRRSFALRGACFIIRYPANSSPSS